MEPCVWAYNLHFDGSMFPFCSSRVDRNQVASFLHLQTKLIYTYCSFGHNFPLMNVGEQMN